MLSLHIENEDSDIENDVSNRWSEAKNQVSEDAKKEVYKRLEQQNELYCEQRSWAEKKIKNHKGDIYISLIILFLVSGIDFVLGVIISTPGGFILAGAWETWVAVIALFAAWWCSFFKLVDHIAIYNIHNETNHFFEKLKQKYDYFTLKDEINFCIKEIQYIEKLKNDLIITEDKEVIENCREYRYTEKRANSISGVLDNKTKVICFIISFLLLKAIRSVIEAL